jgi:membrane associated rhomboid family serine protease
MPMIGASGAIAAVLGAYLLAYPLSRVTVLLPIFIVPFFFDVPALIFLGVWFVEQLFAGTAWALSPLAAQAGGVAWWGHVGGFLAGALLVVASWRRAKQQRPRLRPRGAPPRTRHA